MIMKNAIKSILVGGTMLAATSASQAELETEIYAGYHSIYEFRGVDFGDDLFDAGIDFTYDLGDGFSLNAGLWYADTDGNNANAAFDELDYYIGLTKTIGAVDVSVGYTYYDFPGDSDHSEEYFIGLSTEFENGIGVSLTYFDDFNSDGGDDTTEGEYLELEATKSWELSPCVGLDLAVGAAWSFDYNSDVDGGDLDGFNHYFVAVAAPWTISESFTLTPYVKFVGAASDLANDENGDSEDLFYGGLSLSYAF